MAATPESLALLEAHGRAFLESFGISSSPSTKRAAEAAPPKSSNKRRRTSLAKKVVVPPSEPSSDEESQDEALEAESTSDPEASDEPAGSEKEEHDEPSNTPSTSKPTPRLPEVVTFAQPQYSKAESSSRALRGSFMSSKVSRITSAGDGISNTNGGDALNPDDEIDKSHAQNDHELHKLLHTHLLSSTFNPSIALTESSAKRKKSLEGRVLELADKSKLGKGEKDVRKAEKKKAILRIREGMKEKELSRAKANLEEAKNVGNYHPALKKLFDPTADEEKPKVMRERGLQMGVGRHTSTGLKISRAEIESVTGASSRSGSRGRGGSGGRGGRGGHGGRGGGGKSRGRGKRH